MNDNNEEIEQFVAYMIPDEPITKEDLRDYFRVLDEHWEPTGEGDIFINESPSEWEGVWFEGDEPIYEPDK